MRICLIFVILWLSACARDTQKKPRILSLEKMQAVMSDFIAADVYVSQFIKQDTTRNPYKESVALQKRIFSNHKISRKVFYDSYRYYSDHPDKMRALLDTIVVRNQKNKSKPLKMRALDV